ncbi:MAG TPA: VOC family protein [Patescibacteria group bacterium]|nr:VOC family protein [Patescibacteria group bacterium]
MFDHVMLKVKDLNASKRFYTAALAPLGFSVQYEGDGMLGFGPKGAPALWLAQGDRNGPVHVAFTAKDRASVKAFYDAALPAAGKDNGKPGLRPEYHANYYGGFVKDPDGNNIEAVCHKDE